MKKIILLLVITVFSLEDVSCQWYYEKYNANDINDLTLDQLEESLGETKEKLRNSAFASLAGGVVIGVGFFTLYYGLGEDPSFLEELLGSEFMGRLYIVTGAAIITGSLVCCFTNIGRIGRIKTTIYNNYPEGGSLSFSPVILVNKNNYSVTPGLKLTVRF